MKCLLGSALIWRSAVVRAASAAACRKCCGWSSTPPHSRNFKSGRHRLRKALHPAGVRISKVGQGGQSSARRQWSEAADEPASARPGEVAAARADTRSTKGQQRAWNGAPFPNPGALKNCLRRRPVDGLLPAGNGVCLPKKGKLPGHFRANNSYRDETCR